LEDLEVDERIILRWIINKMKRGCRTGVIWFRTWTRGGLLLTR